MRASEEIRDRAVFLGPEMRRDGLQVWGGLRTDSFRSPGGRVERRGERRGSGEVRGWAAPGKRKRLRTTRDGSSDGAKSPRTREGISYG